MIYIVRHGETDWNIVKRYQGRKDIALNNTGIKQAYLVKEKLKNIDFDVVISSPLKRALETAKIISETNNIIIDDRIIERSNGTLEGKLKSEVDNNINFNSPYENRYKIENINNFRKRVFDFCKDIEKKFEGKNVLVVTHAGVGIYIRCYFEGEPLDNNFKLYKLSNCEIIKYDNKKETIG